MNGLLCFEGPLFLAMKLSLSKHWPRTLM